MEAASAQHRRDYIRYAPINWGVRGSVSDGTRSVPAEFVDESLVGLGMRLTSHPKLATGDVVTIINDRFSRRAKLVFVSPEEAGSVRVGLQWMPNSEYVFT